MLKKILILFIFCFSIQTYGQDLIMQNGTFNQCSGTFFDTGGSGGNYSSNENITITICADNPGDAININFTAFNTQDAVDILSIYDGTDATADLIGEFSGSTVPGLIEPTAANTSGCLTFIFSSNGAGNTIGWAADITCFTPCQNIVANIDSTIPALGTGNTITADENEVITFNGSGTFSVDGTGATYLWDFGDGNTAMGESATHTYTSAGLYVVTLTITDTAGCQNTNSIGLSAIVGSTSPGNPSVDAGDDIDLPCEETCTTLTASFLDIGETTTYTVNSIPYVPPFSFSGLTNSVNTNIDDRWDAVEDLPFEFCFFGDIETQFQVGSNGVIRFDVDASDTSNDWNPSNQQLPSNGDAAVSEPNIFTPLHDIDPSVGDGSDEIAWEIIGTAPNRVLAVSFFNVPMWTCNAELATHMAVFYETTNVVDIYIENAPFCSSWNNNKVVGIQNDAGTEAFVPPGRNTNEGGGWTATQEAWRFTPAGDSIVEFAWLDATGTVISTDANFEVCPTDPSTTYTAQVTYTNCNGDVTIVTDDVTVTTNLPFTINLGSDINLCEGDPDVTLDATSVGATSYQWSLNATDLAGETNPMLTVSSPDSGTYTITTTDAAGCIVTDDIEINFAPIPVANPVDDQVVCDDDNDGFWDFDFTTFDATIIGAQTNVLVSYHNSLINAENNADPILGLYTNMAAFTQETIYIRIESISNGQCFDTAEFTIDVITGPIANPVADQLICDDNNDGFWDFDLAALRTTVLNGQVATDFTVSFHSSMADADTSSATNPLPDTYTNQNAYQEETIYVRIEDNSSPDCYNTTTFLIDVFDVPTANIVEDQLRCDDDNDGFWDFDFSALDAAVLGTQPNTQFEVSFHNTLVDAQNDVNPIIGLYTNAAAYAAETIFARIENVDNTDCFATTDFEIDVFNSAIANPVDDQLICDDDNDGFWDFDLAALRPTILGVQPIANYTVTFHPSQMDADDNTAALPDTYTNMTAYTAETIYVRIEDNGNTTCFGTTDFMINVFEVPTANTVDDQLRCDDDNDGFWDFDFTALDATVLGTQANTQFEVSYHNSLVDAQSDMNPIIGLYTNAAAYTAETIFVRIGNNANMDCADTTSFDIDVFNSAIANPVDDQLVCDDNNDGFWDFDLAALRPIILGTQPMADYTVTFHPSQMDANDNTAALPDTYTNMAAYTAETIYVRIEDNTNTTCFSTTDFEINVFDVPTANTVMAQLQCDDNDDGFWDFDFTTLDAIVVGTQVSGDLEVSYHNNLVDAQNDMNPIIGLYTNATAFTAETIFVRIEVIANPICAATTSFEINVFDTPTANPVDDQLICDGNNDGLWDFDLAALRATVLGTQAMADYTVTFHPSQMDADDNTAALPDTYTNMTAYTAETIFVRIENNANTTCFETASFEIDVFDVPTANAVDDQLICDDNNDGFWVFDFAALEATVLGTQDNMQFDVTFHASQVDADGDTGALPSPYTNQTAYLEETIFVRIENVDNMTCADTSISFLIDVFNTPIANPVDDQLICDDNNDGFWDFDLDALRSTVLNTQAAADYTVTFHPTQADADANASALPDTYTNMVAYTEETIFVRIENNANTLCFDTTEFDIDVFNSPTANPVMDQLICDDNNDGFWNFDLDALRATVLNGQSNTEFNVSFYTSQLDADNGDNPLPDTYTNATAYTAETIFVRIENVDNTTCEDVSISFEINVFETPTANAVDDQFVCDDNNDGFWDFDLDALRTDVYGTQATTDFTVSFHTSQADADASSVTNPLPDNYTNTAAYVAETIFVRIENNTNTSCFNTTSFQIDVFNGAIANTVADQPFCDEDGDGFNEFDLGALRPQAFGTQTAVDYSVSFHTSQEDADDGDNPLPDLYTNANSFVYETIFVRVESNFSDCFDTSTFELQVNPLPEDNVVITPFNECENNTDFLFDFDLETKTNEILNGQDPAIFEVTYYENQMDADNLMNPIVGLYENTMNPQTIYVAITNTQTTCSISTLSFVIEVIEGAAATDDLYEECDVVGDNDGSTQFVLDSRNANILNGQDPTQFSVSYHFSFDDAFDNADPLPLLYENLVNPQIIYARVSNSLRPDECFGISELTLQTNLLPDFDLDDQYILCLSSNDDGVVDVPLVIDTGLSEVDFDFVWRFNGEVMVDELSSSITPVEGGTYDVTVTDVTTSTVTMCTNFDSTEVIESGIPDTFTIDVTSETFSGNNMIVVETTGVSTYEYSLDNGPWQLSGEFEDVTGGDHTVFARDINGCGIISQMVTVIDYAKFFTPNGDGNNDTWTIKGIDSQPFATIYIHDRYGKLLKQLSPTSPGWDGTYNGNRMPSSDYWFTLEYLEPINNEKRTFTAHFALKR